MVRRFCLIVLMVGVVAARAGAQDDGRPECAQYPSASVTLPNGYPFDAYRAVALFRFHRQPEGLRELDAGRAIVRGPWRWRIPPDQRQALASELDALRSCLATTQPKPLATLRVRVLGYAPDTADRIVPQSGARVSVEGVPVGDTGPDGTLTARVPSGPIRVEAAVPIDQWNSVDLSPRPGESESVEITLSEGKEVREPTVLVLAEAVDDIVPLTSKSLTLKFMRDGRLAPVTSIDDIEAEDATGKSQGPLDKLFSVIDGAIVATNASRLLGELASQFRGTIRLSVQAMAFGRLHQGDIAFQVGQSSLSVRLAPPPSNPTLPVSNVAVGISLVGAGIAVERVSDATGAFKIDSFPHGTVALECVAVSNGKYYYGQATLAHSRPRSVTLVLRHVDDIKNGVPPLRLSPASAEAGLPPAGARGVPRGARHVDDYRTHVHDDERSDACRGAAAAVRRGTDAGAPGTIR